MADLLVDRVWSRRYEVVSLRLERSRRRLSTSYSTKTATHVSTLVLDSAQRLSLGVAVDENWTNLTKWPHMSPLSALVTFVARQPRKGWRSLFGPRTC